MRGKGYDVVSRLCRVRITPACAGKSTKSRNAIRSRWDHPRMCGEKNIWVADVTTSIGSPPHVRGKAIAQTSSCRRTGITPAYAGKSFVSFFHCTTFWDHPRVCGEKVGGISARSCCTGSPPRMRGKESHARRKRQAHGITPACAGKSSRPDRPSTGLLDHPRVCGEKFFAAYGAMPLSGSPPRMRGKD